MVFRVHFSVCNNLLLGPKYQIKEGVPIFNTKSKFHQTFLINLFGVKQPGGFGFSFFFFLMLEKRGSNSKHWLLPLGRGWKGYSEAKQLNQPL